jgi:hypothetical protein
VVVKEPGPTSRVRALTTLQLKHAAGAPLQQRRPDVHPNKSRAWEPAAADALPPFVRIA